PRALGRWRGLPVVTADAQAAVNTALPGSFGFGNEVHPAGGDRGLTGLLSKIRVVGDPEAGEPFEFQPMDVTEDLLDLGFDGELEGAAYSPAGSEVLTGDFTVREGTTVADGALTVAAATGGGDFTAAEDPF